MSKFVARCGPICRFGATIAQGKCTKPLHLEAPDKCTSIGQSPSGRAGRIWRSREGGKHLTQDALEAAWEHDGHLGLCSATSPTIWDASPSCGDILITNQPSNQPRGQMHHFLPALSLSLMTSVVKDWDTGSRRLAIIRDVEKLAKIDCVFLLAIKRSPPESRCLFQIT